MVGLDEPFRIPRSMEQLDEPAPIVGVDLRLRQNHARDPSDRHRAPLSTASAYSSSAFGKSGIHQSRCERYQATVSISRSSIALAGCQPSARIFDASMAKGRSYSVR